MTSTLDADVTAGSWPDWVVAAMALMALGVSLATLQIQLIDRRRLDAASIDSFQAESPTAVVVNNGGTRTIGDVRVLLEMSDRRWKLKASRCHRIAGGAQQAFEAEQPIASACSLAYPVLKITVSFTDPSGRRWRRTNDGRLRRCRPWHELRIDPVDGSVDRRNA